MFEEHRTARRKTQQVEVLTPIALFVIFLLAFMAISLDLGRLFVVKSELQTAMDSCALSAAQELDGQGDSITRATSAGIMAGNLNNVNFRSTAWSGQVRIDGSGVTYRNAAYAVTTNPDAKYAQCTHAQPYVPMWVLRIMGMVFGETAAVANTPNAMVSAVATLVTPSDFPGRLVPVLVR